jgi:hypothetical protein
MVRLTAYSFIGVLLLSAAFKASAQTTRIDSVKTELQGAWRMTADTNVVLIFTGDSMVYHMVRSWGKGKVRFRITDKNCDTTRHVKENALYLVETYRYYQHKTPADGKVCNKIVYLKSGTLILKREGLFETYTKLHSVPVLKK